MRILLMMAAVSALIVTPAAAQGVNARQANQGRRVEQGVRSGVLTTREASRVRQGQRRLARQEARMRAKSGGRLDARQRARLNAGLDRQNAQIRRLKHNARRHYGRSQVCYRHHGARRCVWR